MIWFRFHISEEHGRIKQSRWWWWINKCNVLDSVFEEKLGPKQQQAFCYEVQGDLKKPCFISQIPDLEHVLVLREHWVKINWLWPTTAGRRWSFAWLRIGLCGKRTSVPFFKLWLINPWPKDFIYQLDKSLKKETWFSTCVFGSSCIFKLENVSFVPLLVPRRN